MRAAAQITDRAKRYRAQGAVTGKRVCVICGKKPKRIDVMHLDGNESHGEQANLAYGCRSCNGKLAAAFKRIGAGVPTNQYNPAKKEIPTFEQYAFAVASGERDYYPNSTRHASGVKDEAGAIIHATPKHKRIEYAKRIASNRKARSNPWPFSTPKGRSARDTTPASGGIAHHSKGKRATAKAAKPSASAKAAKYDLDTEALSKHYAKGGTLAEFLRANPAQCNPVEAETYSREQAEAAAKELRRQHHTGVKIIKRARHSRYPYTSGPPNKPGRKSTQNVLYVVTSRGQLKRNPAKASAAAYREFHGHGPRETVIVSKKVHVHEHLAAAGTLRKLVVLGIDKQTHKIAGFKGALLAFNEDKNQLFVEGGDQSLNLEDFGIRKPHEFETLGKVKVIDYHADKSHLGDEGGNATYTHQFRTTNENGSHVVVKVSRYPDLIYDVRNEQLLFSGGSYTIRAEGIDV